jgi:hypothetical protein
MIVFNLIPMPLLFKLVSFANAIFGNMRRTKYKIMEFPKCRRHGTYLKQCFSSYHQHEQTHHKLHISKAKIQRIGSELNNAKLQAIFWQQSSQDLFVFCQLIKTLGENYQHRHFQQFLTIIITSKQIKRGF